MEVVHRHLLQPDPVDLSGLQSLVTRGVLLEDDRECAHDERGERAVVEAVLSGESSTLFTKASPMPGRRSATLKRRFAYRWIDLFSK